ncbi:haloacid dehalogenase [Paenibacillus agaridevorans]|uniref:Haloacid dehalogenase n=1 Tax=Paenibacillus agaridevorans TaxID=171404 RepID=A0A2R5EXZ0_9BACL|nr:HAD-IIA family hydrolase [Paenibacillus agaridevorans]GBG08224.1 haloacid dehalogenase [Paenibacillus agaridevorans]
MNVQQAESGIREQLLQCEAFFFDLDGCVYYGSRPAPGAAELINELRVMGKHIRFITNNSTDSSHSIAEKLHQMGLEAEPGEILTATEYIGPYLSDCYGAMSVKVIGSRDLHLALENAGHRLMPYYSGQRADAVVIGRDVTFTYEKLCAIVEELDKGAIAIVTNPDLHHPGSRGEKVPEAGTFAAAFEAMIGRKLAFFGKPAPHLFLAAMRDCGVERAERCVMIGDNLATDVAGGKAAGMRTIWLANKSPADWTAQEQVEASWVFQDLNALLVELRG